MSGKKGMNRYPKTIKEMIIKEWQEGASFRGLSRKYCINHHSIREWCGVDSRVNQRLMNPKRKGRPCQVSVDPEKADKQEIKRLKMENELLRSFLHAAGRM